MTTIMSRFFFALPLIAMVVYAPLGQGAESDRTAHNDARLRELVIQSTNATNDPASFVAACDVFLAGDVTETDRLFVGKLKARSLVHAWKSNGNPADAEDAISLYSDCLQTDSNDVSALSSLAMLYLDMENFDEAQALIDRMGTIQPEPRQLKPARERMALVQRRHANSPQIIHAQKISQLNRDAHGLAQSLSESPRPEGFLDLGDLYWEIGSLGDTGAYSQAISAWQKATEYDATAKQALKNLLTAYISLRDYENALSSALRIHDQDPDLARSTIQMNITAIDGAMKKINAQWSSYTEPAKEALKQRLEIEQAHLSKLQEILSVLH
jgi:tetratricopeptide (TPR) repeat protein